MPEDWLREMGCHQSDDTKSKSDDIQESESSKMPIKNNPHQKPKQRIDEELEPPLVSVFDSVKSIFISVLAAVLAGLAYYYISTRPATLQQASRGLTASAIADASILEVYDYMSTPDFRTEWHFNAVEINGPAIDHSAIPGKMSNPGTS